MSKQSQTDNVILAKDPYFQPLRTFLITRLGIFNQSFGYDLLKCAKKLKLTKYIVAIQSRHYLIESPYYLEKFALPRPKDSEGNRIYKGLTSNLIQFCVLSKDRKTIRKIKVYQTGSFQVPGCRQYDTPHARFVLKIFMKYWEKYKKLTGNKLSSIKIVSSKYVIINGKSNILGPEKKPLYVDKVFKAINDAKNNDIERPRLDKMLDKLPLDNEDINTIKQSISSNRMQIVNVTRKIDKASISIVLVRNNEKYIPTKPKTIKTAKIIIYGCNGAINYMGFQTVTDIIGAYRFICNALRGRMTYLTTPLPKPESIISPYNIKISDEVGYASS